ncbi:MAG: 3-deoxy-manno-octulosonate cytidylyltransferase [Bacteroidales bacterium]|nr:3-deoxy-manno-octulosonate cytidylyltransferase [Bacteroidales bacterium]
MENNLKYIGIIPARYGSTRFPGKPLALINGKSMIKRVYEQASKASVLSKVLVATDDERIASHVKSFDGNWVITSDDHDSGTERCCEAMIKEWGQAATGFVVINIQGDEPYLRPQQINELAGCFNDPKVDIATLIKPVKKPETLVNPNHVKVVIDSNGFAIYFSRAAIPYLRNKTDHNLWPKEHIYYKHLGIYAYRADVLERIVKLPQGKLEQAESLEQLRWLENGYRIKTKVTDFESISIDTPEDLKNL